MELLDIYDDNKVKTGRIHERGKAMKKGDYTLVVHLWIVNDKGKILIQKRQSCKNIWPDMWDSSVAGAAIKGDDSKEAILRETKEELGVDLDISRAEFLFSFKRDWWFDDIWIARQNIDIKDLKLQYEEVADARWVSYDEIKIMMKNGEFIKYDYMEKLEQIIKEVI